MYTSAPWTSGLLSDSLPNTSERYRRSYCFSLHSKYCGQALQSAKRNIAVDLPSRCRIAKLFDDIVCRQCVVGVKPMFTP
jgi:hypothetical protein